MLTELRKRLAAARGASTTSTDAEPHVSLTTVLAQHPSKTHSEWDDYGYMSEEEKRFHLSNAHGR